MPTCAPSWPWPLMTNGIRPARLRIHIRSSTARARATWRYMSRSSSSDSPTASPRWLAWPTLPDRGVTAIWSSVAGSEVDRSAVNGHRRLAEDLRERRVGMRGAADLPRRGLELERNRRLGDEIRGMRPDDVDPERLVGPLVGDDLGKALVLATDDRLRDRLERHLADLDRQAALLALLLGQPDRGNLGPAVRRPRLLDVIDLVDILLTGDDMRGRDPLVGRGVGEHQPADDIPDRIHVRLLRPHPAVDLDETTVGLDLRRLEPDLLDVRRPAGSDEHQLRAELLRLLALGPDHQADAVLVRRDGGGIEAGLRHDGDAAPAEAALERLADLAVLERHDRRQVFEDRDLDPEIVVHRGE